MQINWIKDVCTLSSLSGRTRRREKVINTMSLGHMKLVVIGDGAVGKTSLIYTFFHKEFPKKYVPTIMDHFQTRVPVKKKDSIVVSIWDTAGQEDYAHLRKLCYVDASVIMMCYSCVSMVSLDSLETRWLPEVIENQENPNIVVIGTKTDLKELVDEKKVVKLEYGVSQAKELEAFGLVECSAMNEHNIREAFALAISAHLNKIRKRRKCVIF